MTDRPTARETGWDDGDRVNPITNEWAEADDRDENTTAIAEGHPEACWYTIKATRSERMEHYSSRQPECDGFSAVDSDEQITNPGYDAFWD